MVGTGRADRNLPLDELGADKVRAFAMDLVEKTFTPPKTVGPPQR